MIVSHLIEAVLISVLGLLLRWENKKRDRIQSQMEGGLEGRDLGATAFMDLTDRENLKYVFPSILFSVVGLGANSRQFPVYLLAVITWGTVLSASSAMVVFTLFYKLSDSPILLSNDIIATNNLLNDDIERGITPNTQADHLVIHHHPKGQQASKPPTMTTFGPGGTRGYPVIFLVHPLLMSRTSVWDMCLAGSRSPCRLPITVLLPLFLILHLHS
jgi:hypothetical protein